MRCRAQRDGAYSCVELSRFAALWRFNLGRPDPQLGQGLCARGPHAKIGECAARVALLPRVRIALEHAGHGGADTPVAWPYNPWLLLSVTPYADRRQPCGGARSAKGRSVLVVRMRPLLQCGHAMGSVPVSCRTRACHGSFGGSARLAGLLSPRSCWQWASLVLRLRLLNKP